MESDHVRIQYGKLNRLMKYFQSSPVNDYRFR